jgi:hypothetical protein
MAAPIFVFKALYIRSIVSGLSVTVPLPVEVANAWNSLPPQIIALRTLATLRSQLKSYFRCFISCFILRLHRQMVEAITFFT